MKPEIVIELPSEKQGTLRMGRVEKHGLETVSADSFRGSPRTRAVAFAPALLVSRFTVTLSARTESEARRAALYAVEEDLAQPVDDVALALGPKRAGEQSRVAYVVDRQVLEAWRNQLENIGLGHVPIIAENSLSTRIDKVWDFGDRLLMMRDGETLCLDKATGDETVSGVKTAAGFGATPVQSSDSLPTLLSLHLENPGVAIDIGRSARTRGFKAWQTAAVLALAGGLIWTVTQALEAHEIQTAANRAEASAREIFRMQFPGAAEPADVHSEVRRILQQTTPATSNTFRTISASLFKAIAASETIRLSRLSFSADNGTLQAELMFAGPADEAAFRSRLERGGVRIEAADVTELSDGVTGRFMLRSGT
jgi:general secretion pathway protein L